jgi:hypothetical protein
MVNRIVRIIKLDFPVFKEIEDDPNATTEAAIIVVVAAFLSAIGSAFGAARPVVSFFSTLLSSVVGWVVWSYVSHYVGQAMFKGKGTPMQMLRVVGYANAPQLLGILNIIPCIGWIGGLAGAILSLIASIMAIREALDLETGQAIIVALVGWVALAIVGLVFGVIFGVSAGIAGAIFGAGTR